MLPALTWSLAALAAPPSAPDDARGSIAVYCAEQCGEIELPGFAVRQRLPRVAGAPSASVERWGGEFGVPDEAQRAEWGTGDLAGMAEAKDVVVLSWAAPRDQAAAAVAAAGRAALATGQWFEDLDTGALYDAPALEERLARYEGSTPDVTALLLIDGVQEGETVRLVTRGLSKVGLPELVMEGVPAGQETARAAALNATAQLLYERGLTGSLAIDAAEIRSAAARAGACEASGQARLSLARGGPDDPPGPLALVDFRGEVGRCGEVAAPAPAASPKRPTPQAGPSTLEEAQAAALERLRGPVRAAFAAGLPRGEALMVKAPFNGPDGRVEWLWIIVDEWRDDGLIAGKLGNQPALLPDLARGDRVAVEEALVFDYLWVRADGQREGNTTAEFLR